METEILYSVIIPVYNTGFDYVERALDSISCQETKNNVEVLIVDDGSEADYADELDNRLIGRKQTRIIHKQHSGVSDTRNYGIKESKGEYVTFVDADDEVTRNFLADTEEILRREKPDIVYGTLDFQPKSRYSGIQSDGKEYVLKKEEVLEAKKALFDVRPRTMDLAILGSPCGRLYRAELAKKVLFRTEITLHEDQIFNRECLNIAKSVVVIPNELYVYYQHSDSAIHTKTIDDPYEKWKTYWDRVYELNKDENEECVFRLRVRALGQFYSYIAKYVSADANSINKINQAVEHPLFKDAIESLDERDSRLTKSQRIVLHLLKNKKYRTLFVLSKLKNNENK